MTAIHVVLADDHRVMRESLRLLLENTNDIRVVGEARNGREALELVEALVPDVLILDMEMPVLGGLEVTQRLQAAKSPVRIMALSAREDRQYILGVLAAGTSGYFIKGDASPETIINAVRGIARGEQDWFSPSVASQMSALSSQSTQTSLTNREKDILRSVVAGKTNQEIGAMLGLSEEMVEKQLGDIFKKLKVVSRVKAAIRAVEEGLV